MNMTNKEKKLLNEKRKKYTNDNKNKWLNTSNETFAKFASSLSDYPNTSVRKTSKRIKKNLLLEQTRLKYFGLNVKYEYITTDNDKLYDRFNNTNDNYKNNLCFKNCTKKISYYKAEKKIKEFKTRSILYANIIDVKNKDHILNDTYCCPNCGAVNKIKDLDIGCQYCNTKFRFDEIYPIVKTYYTIFDYSPVLPSKKTFIAISYILGVILSWFIFLEKKYSITKLLVYSMLGGVLGIPFMYILLSLGILLIFFMRLIIGTKYSVPVNVLLSKNKIKKLLRKYDSNYIYESFEGLIISYIKGIVYNSDCTKLSYYTGSNRNFKSIINVDYLGGIKLNSYNIKDNILSLNLVVYMLDTIYENNNHIYQKKHPYNVTVCKDTRIQNDSAFSIEKITCNSCGSSFDAENIKECPYCKKEFNLIDYDYIITELN